MNSAQAQSNIGESLSPLTHLRAIWQDPRVRLVLLILYYLLIVAGLIVMYGRGDFSTPPFIYQAF